jgi:hypothetical protein
VDAVIDRFVDHLSTAWTALVEPGRSESGNFRLARDAVAESVATYERKCFFASTLQGVFADHYKEHALALADHFLSTVLRLEISSDSPLRDPQCLVLVFCAFAWHDAGMAFLPEGSQRADIEAMLRRVKVRQEHSRRSLEVLDSLDLGSELPCWTHFWSECAGPAWPRPAELYARDLLARICQSHGDDLPEWLSDESLGSYERTNPKTIVSFSDAFGDSWPSVRPLVLAAAGALNLCDLLDIRSTRLRLPRERELNAFASESLEDRRQTLLHWAAHQILSVEPASEKIDLVAHPGRGLSRLSLQVAAHSGPGKALLNYGNSPRLTETLRRVGVRYQGVDLARGAVDDRAWQEIATRLASPTFQDCWSDLRRIRATATEENDEPLLEQVVNVEWWNQFAGDLGQAGDNALPPGAISSELRIVLKALRSRLPLDELVEIEPVLDRPGPVLLTVEAPISGGERLAEAFVGGVALVKHFLSSPETPPLAPRISLAFRGNETHRKLTAGEFSGKNSGRNIVFVCMRPKADLTDYEHLIDRHDKWPLVLFCSGSVEQERMLRPRVRSVVVRPRPERLLSIARNIAAIDIRVDPVRVDFGASASASGSSVVSLLLDLCQQGSGGELIRNQIMDGLSDRPSPDRATARSLVFWLAMLELFDGGTDASGEVQRAVSFWSEQRPRAIRLLPAEQITQLMTRQPPFMAVSSPGVSNENDLGEIDLLQVTRRQILAEAFDEVPEVELMQIAEAFMAIAQGRWARVDCTGISRQGLALQALTLILDACLLGPVAQDAEFEPDEREIDISIRAIESFVNRSSIADKIAVLKYLDGISPAFSASRLAILAFQLSYRLARTMESFDEILAEEVGEVSKLGMLEAIASSSARGAEQEQLQWEFVTKITTDCRQRAIRSGIDDYVLMMYDICAKYRNRPNFPDEAAEPLLTYGSEHALEPIADYFHDSSDRAVPAATRRTEVFNQWRALRAHLLHLERSTPREYRRERVSPVAEHRSRPTSPGS